MKIIAIASISEFSDFTRAVPLSGAVQTLRRSYGREVARSMNNRCARTTSMLAF